MGRTLFCWSGSLLCAGAVLLATSQEPQPLSIWAQRQFTSWDNPLHTEVEINGTTVNIFSSDTIEPIAEQLKPEWNTFVLKTTPQVPASKANGLIFRVGPTTQKGSKTTMAPVLWRFDNKTDWRLEDDGSYSHPLGPSVSSVDLTYKVYYAGMERENRELKAGDYVLVGKPTFTSWNTPVVATVWINGTPFNSFTTVERQVIVTDLLKPGKNEIKLVSTRVPNAIKENDIAFWVGGPAEWSVTERRFVLKPLVQFKAKQGWRRNRQTGQLENPMKAGADEMERVIPFMLKPASSDKE